MSSDTSLVLLSADRTLEVQRLWFVYFRVQGLLRVDVVHIAHWVVAQLGAIWCSVDSSV